MPPIARTVPEIRLRLHVLCFNHLQLCKELFSKPRFLSQRRIVKAQRRTDMKREKLREEIKKLLKNPSQVTQAMVEKAGFKDKAFQQLKVLELEQWYLALKGNLFF